MMKVEIIRSEVELESVEPFYVRHLLWGTRNLPETYGYIGFVPEEGFYLKMICEEKEPLRTYGHDMDPVCQDSAMEAFFLFETGGTCAEHPGYMNLEMNANGALLAAYGENREHRTNLSKEQCLQVCHRAKIGEASWEISLHIPLCVLDEIYGPLHLGKGSTFSCNFYKISETKEIEHYASYAPVLTETPDFHRPEFFEKAVISGTD